MTWWTKTVNFVTKYWQWILMVITAIAFFLLGRSKDAKKQQKIIVLVLNKNRSKKRNLQIQLLISILHNYSRINHKNDFRDMRRFHHDSTPNTHDNTMCSIFCLETNTAASVTQPIKNLVKLRGVCQSLNFISLSLVVNSCEDCRNRYKLETWGAGDTGQII